MVSQKLQSRQRTLIVISIAFFVMLWIRLLQLQIFHTQEYQAKSEANSIRVVEELPGRGVICDRHGRVIVENRPSYSLSLIPYEAWRNPDTFAELAVVLSRSESELKTATETYGRRSYQAVKIARDVDFHTLAAYKSRALQLPGVNDQFEPKRYYPYGVAPHILGYIAEISETEKKRFPNRKTGDIVGKSGIERTYEDLLAGQKGYHYLVVNALGQITDEITNKYIPPRSGGKLYLTLDMDLQLLAEQLLEGKRGAVVALDPNNGEILAIASAPKYDPEVFSGVLRSEDWQRLQNDPEVPLLNRSLQSGYPMASTFKMLTLAAAIQEGIVAENYSDVCTGSYWLGRTYHCFQREGHGMLTPIEAIEQSCDAFFYKLGHKLGIGKLAYYMKIFGFGTKTGIDIENEVPGIIPDSTYLNERYGKGEWSPGLALNVAVGQGEVLATPLQLAQYGGILATGGTKSIPHLFYEMDLPGGEIKKYIPQSAPIAISTKTFAILREGMRRVVEGEKGTAKWLKNPRWQMAGKTGTAQNPHGEDHALFIGFAPFENPIIAVAVVVENAGFGSTHAAPIAVKIMSRYMELTQVPEETIDDKVAQSH